MVDGVQMQIKPVGGEIFLLTGRSCKSPRRVMKVKNFSVRIGIG